MKLPIQIKILIGIVIILVTISTIGGIFTSSTVFYNTELEQRSEYEKLVEEQLTTFDNNYLIFKDKSNIAELNKETFVKVTEIIMSNRKDGQQLAWKWVSENQQIPYDEFTVFYRNLSEFTQQRYNENNIIEKKKQEIAKKHNLLISSYPGVIYNHFFKFEKLEYKRGFLTKETKDLFFPVNN